MDESFTPVFFCTGIAPHLHGSIGDTKGVIFPTSQFFSEVHCDFTGTGRLEAVMERADQGTNIINSHSLLAFQKVCMF